MRPPTLSVPDRVVAVCSWLRGAVVTWCLAVVYLAIVAGVSFPVVGTVAGGFWLRSQVTLGPAAGSLYLVGIGAVVVVEFTLLRSLLDAVGTVVLRPDTQ